MIRRTILLGALALAALGATVSPVAAKDGDIVRAGNCSGASNWELKLSPEDGRIEVEFEVDQNRNNRLWRVSLAKNGVVVYRTSRYTRAPSGSFTVHRLMTNGRGQELIVARATNVATGETCRATARATF
jgi:hypothetical protein